MPHLQHLAIATKDPEKVAAFFQKVFDLKFVKRVPMSPRGGGVFLTDGHINFAFIDFPTVAAADMEGGAKFEGLHHIGFVVEDVSGLEKRMASVEAEKLSSAVNSDYKFYHEVKFRGPHGIILDISSGGWDVEEPRPATEEKNTRQKPA